MKGKVLEERKRNGKVRNKLKEWGNKERKRNVENTDIIVKRK
jgi:hypothetical protein